MKISTILLTFSEAEIRLLAESIQIKEKVRAEMRAANPQYTLDEALVKSFGLEAEAAE